MNENIQDKWEVFVTQEQTGIVSSLCSQEIPGGVVGLNLFGWRKLILYKTRGLGLQAQWGAVRGPSTSPGEGPQPDSLTEAPGPSASQVLQFLK